MTVWTELEHWVYPLLEGGAAAPIKYCHVT